YLRSRCPLCFGGSPAKRPNERPDYIVCLDACFTQKRRKGKGDGRDHPRPHAETVFVPEADVKAMEERVDNLRPSRSGPSQSDHRSRGDDAEDGYEGNLKIPVSVLDGCNESFLAADEKRHKASTQFFADTGLMALLCRHDRVLWLVNMTFAGERQFYALALISRLFEHIPPDATVGILYDIACQLHRSCVKWGLLDDHLLGRILFAISIFHAFGHQWPCQVIYHPRKCLGFGLTDGEECERFWSSIRPLISTLRVSGYHQRLFVLDTQVKHLDEQSLARLGHWLGRKWIQCHDKKLVAQNDLAACRINEHVLREEWKAQVKEQTKPAPRRTKNGAKHAIEAILALQKSADAYKTMIRDLEHKLARPINSVDIAELSLQLEEARHRAAQTSDTISRKKAALGISDRVRLTKLLNDEFLRIRMNAQALKQRIRDRLRHRKFEIERLERSYRQTVSERKLTSHTENSVKRREPGILKLTKAYNELCKQLVGLIQKKKSPPRAVAPVPIEVNGLFKLDVDDDIWQDVGLDDDETGAAVPRWLGDDSVRAGIKALLILDRCKEEEARLREERRAMQEWLSEEWECVQHARHDAGEFHQ
ncbi:uncharacterized protein LAESUDRAFT_667904, partial [Laetiporus sulphureus 93-53]